MDRRDIMAEALYRYDETTTSWVQVSSINLIEVTGTSTASAGAKLAVVILNIETIHVASYLATVVLAT
jgi:N-acetylneuraminic acid mutarotase